jgi:uncharacterized protein YndB with AHSA1/START domain
MKTRKHVHEETYPVDREDLFALLHTPSAIRGWWGASRSIVIPEAGGIWASTWGDNEDEPEYITVATIREFDPPQRLVLSDYKYRARDGKLPFNTDFILEFLVTPDSKGSVLRLTQEGFPAGPEGEEYFSACQKGWSDTFAGIRRHLGNKTGVA